jgi:N-acetylglucosaminyldiphosphoundecaprenol N-acetyl-beta-D-mannosaminyltransferase
MHRMSSRYAVSSNGNAPPRAGRGRLMGMPLDGLTLPEAVGRVVDGLAEGRGGAVLTPNIDILRQYRRSSGLQRAFEHTELLVPDGVPLVWASRLQGTPVPERITGSDMLAAVTAAAASRDASVALVGGRPGVARRAADRLRLDHPGLRASAHPCYGEPGPLDPQIEDVVNEVVAEGPDLVYVGLPFTAQVHVIGVLRSRLPRAWFLGVGSCFDLVNGDRVRAPEWLQRLGLEWAHRVVHEPHVWRRYLLQGMPFAARLGAHALRNRVVRSPGA